MASILSVAREFSRRLLERERETVAAMVRAWAVAFERIDLELRALIERLESAVAAGETVNESWLWRRGRLEDLLMQAGFQTRHFADFAEIGTITDKAKAVQLAIESAGKFIALPRPVDAPVVRLSFNRAPQEALEKLVGTFSDGSPLSRIFAGFGQQQVVLVQDALVRGVALGKGPRVIAREVRDVAGIPLNRALTITRTEALRAYRSASLANYRENADIIDGWIRIEKLDLRTCPVCWALHGEVSRLDDEAAAHPNCRFATAPTIIGVPHGIVPGAIQFEELTEAQQLQVLGPSKFEAYRRGRITLDDLVMRENDSVWGPSVREAALEDAEARRRQLAA